ncbi:rhodanese-like domain-containing protein [Tsuneonella sp. SYSU-LHT278]|uniref:rhodanese-like domain-containing protein n=1 Tax=Tsuneonella sediminis TaxID=3416089 RepID=UPI003F793E72
MIGRKGLVAAAAALALSASACSAESAAEPSGERSAPAAPTITKIDADELSDLIAGGKAVLVDVRTPEEFAEGHIAGAVNLPLQGFDPSAVPQVPGKQTILYCRSGRRSETAAAQMVAAGQPAIHLGGGITAWHDAGHPVTPAD